MQPLFCGIHDVACNLHDWWLRSIAHSISTCDLSDGAPSASIPLLWQLTSVPFCSNNSPSASLFTLLILMTLPQSLPLLRHPSQRPAFPTAPTTLLFLIAAMELPPLPTTNYDSQHIGQFAPPVAILLSQWLAHNSLLPMGYHDSWLSLALWQQWWHWSQLQWSPQMTTTSWRCVFWTLVLM